jgi:hypothetical protein
MAYTEPLNIKGAKDLVKTTLEAAILKLENPEDVVKVEYPLSVEEYKLNQPKGALLVFYKGGEYKDTKLENAIHQDRNMHIGVMAVIKKKQSGMDPEDYIDFCRTALTGLEIAVTRGDNKSFPIADEWIKEEGGEWWYIITVVIPTLNIEQEILDNQ